MQSTGISHELLDYRCGRIFRTKRRVRFGDVDAAGRVRFDAIARYLQDLAIDDVHDAKIDEEVTWLVRRTAVVASSTPLRFGDEMELATWCSGVGTAWAERRSTISVGDGPPIEAVSVGISIDPKEMKPAPTTGKFFDVYREAAGTRKIKSKLILPRPPDSLDGARPWKLRWSDIDVMGHVNNVVSWAAVEDEAHRLVPDGEFRWVELEHNQPIERGEEPSVISQREGDQISVWLLLGDGQVATSARAGIAKA